MKLIQKIEIKHFRSIFDQNIEESNHVNIFGGQNDSGKSNVLRALNLFFNNETSFLDGYNFFDDFSMSSKVKARESKKGKQFISIKIYFNPDGIKGKKNTLIKLAKSSGEGLWVERKWWAYDEVGAYEQNIPDYIKNASQGVKRSFSVFLKSIKFVYIPAFKSNEVFAYILKLSARNKGLFLSNTAKTELESNIEKTTTVLSNDFKDITGIETYITLPISLESFWSSLEVSSQFEGTPESFTRGSKDDYKIKFASRGEGIKSLFVPVVLGWLAEKAKNDHWIWGIDEPENALEALRSDNLFKKFLEYSQYAQVFLSTHSPSFLFPQGSVDRCSIFIAKQEQPGYTNFEKINNRTEELEEIFGYDYGSFLKIQEQYSKSINQQEELKKEVEELRKQGKTPVLFVEGITDKLIVENAWKKLRPRKKQPFLIKEKGNAHQVAYALENSEIFEKDIVIGLFDFDHEGFTRWNGLIGNSGYKSEGQSTIGGCLSIKRNGRHHYGLLLPVPKNGDVRSQVVDKNGCHFGDRSHLTIELLFFNVNSLNSYFIKKGAPGKGRIIEFTGNKKNFVGKTSRLSDSDFNNLKPLIRKIEQVIKKSRIK